MSDQPNRVLFSHYRRIPINPNSSWPNPGSLAVLNTGFIYKKLSSVVKRYYFSIHKSIFQEPCSCQPGKETFQWFVVEQLPDSVRRSFKNVLGTVGLKGGPCCPLARLWFGNERGWRQHGRYTEAPAPLNGKLRADWNSWMAVWIIVWNVQRVNHLL